MDSRYVIKGVSDGGGLGRSIGSVPPPIPVGGAFYAVTHSQRKYHYPHMYLLAGNPGLVVVCGAGGSRSILLDFMAHPPPGSTHMECI